MCRDSLYCAGSAKQGTRAEASTFLSSDQHSAPGSSRAKHPQSRRERRREAVSRVEMRRVRIFLQRQLRTGQRARARTVPLSRPHAPSPTGPACAAVSLTLLSD